VVVGRTIGRQVARHATGRAPGSMHYCLTLLDHQASDEGGRRRRSSAEPSHAHKQREGPTTSLPGWHAGTEC
jgi:hypothetical protein